MEDKILETIVEPEKIYAGSTFKLKIKAIRHITYKEAKKLTYTQLKEYTYKTIKGG